MMKRRLCFILAIVLTLLCIGCTAPDDASADTQGQKDQNQPAEQETEADTYLSRFDGTSFSGYEFRVLCMDSGNNGTDRFLQEIYVDAEDTADIINDAVYRRNSDVEEKLGIKISPVKASEANIMNVAKSSIAAEDNSFDIVNIYKRDYTSLITEGYLRDFKEIPVWDHTQPWWNEKCYEGMQVKGKLFGMSGSILISDIDDTLAMVFNKKLAEDYKIEDMYQLVKDKKWTLEKMCEVAASVSGDIDGDGKYTPGTDLFGYMQDPISMTLNWVFSSRISTGSVDSDGIYTLDIDLDRTQILLEKMAELFSNDYALTDMGLFDGLPYFENNTVFLYAIILRNVEALRAMDADFGIIPYPMLDDKQNEYLTHVGVGSPVIQIPVTNTSDDERLGTILEAMAEASYKYVLPSYYEMALKTKMSRDTLSSDMLDIILAGRVYSFSYYATFSQSSAENLIKERILEKNTDIASALEKNKKRIVSGYQKTLDAIT